MERSILPAEGSLQVSKAAAIPSRDIVDYNLGCPTGTDTPASLEQAALNFKNAGVTDVLMLEITDGGAFTQIAQQQDFKPQYLFAENDTAVNEASGGNAPNPANYNNAVDVFGSAYGEESTPGYMPSGGTQKCNAIYKAAGDPSVPRGSGLAEGTADGPSPLAVRALLARGIVRG